MWDVKVEVGPGRSRENTTHGEYKNTENAVNTADTTYTANRANIEKTVYVVNTAFTVKTEYRVNK